MEKKERKSPKLRFPGFTEPWEQRKLSDEFERFIVPMRDKPKEFGGNIPWTRIEDIEGKYLNDSLSGQYVSEKTVKQMNLKIIPKDSLIVSSSATFGVVAIITQDLITNQTFIGLVPNNKETLDYWYAFFHSDEARRYMRLESAGSTIFYIARESFENMPIITPKKDEMIKIGAYFDNLDHLIALHQRKCDALRRLKTAMLQKMFPRNGEAEPELRFPGFTEPWEQRKLSELLEKYEDPVDTPSDGYERVGIRSHAKGTFHSYVEEGKALEAAKMHRVAADKFILNITFAWEHAVAITDENDAGKLVSHRFPQFSFDEKLKSHFFKYLMLDKKFREYLELCSPGGAGRNRVLKISDMLKYEIRLPSIDEQSKIGEYFDTLDNLITLHQRKCDALKKLKQAMLQKMFV